MAKVCFLCPPTLRELVAADPAPQSRLSTCSGTAGGCGGAGEGDEEEPEEFDPRGRRLAGPTHTFAPHTVAERSAGDVVTESGIMAHLTPARSAQQQSGGVMRTTSTSSSPMMRNSD